ncbi:MAG: hypothetical protein OXD32_06190 [Endozoicomonadaceae bacterium]|nr:hypothetical protein [Endozoicomonadaceae bacterium]
MSKITGISIKPIKKDDNKALDSSSSVREHVDKTTAGEQLNKNDVDFSKLKDAMPKHKKKMSELINLFIQFIKEKLHLKSSKYNIPDDDITNTEQHYGKFTSEKETGTEIFNKNIEFAIFDKISQSLFDNCSDAEKKDYTEQHVGSYAGNVKNFDNNIDKTMDRKTYENYNKEWSIFVKSKCPELKMMEEGVSMFTNHCKNKYEPTRKQFASSVKITFEQSDEINGLVAQQFTQVSNELINGHIKKHPELKLPTMEKLQELYEEFKAEKNQFTQF